MTPGTEKRIKVLFITKWYPNHEDPQLGIFIKKHALAVAAYADVALLYISPFDPAFHFTDFYISEEQNVRQFFLYYKRSDWSLLNIFRYYANTRKGWKAVLKNFGEPDIIHAHVLTRPAVLAYLLSMEHGPPYLITEHWTGFVNNKFFEKPVWYQWITRLVISKASHLTVVSKALKLIMEQAGLKKNVSVIPNVVDLPLKPLKKNIQTGKKLFLTVADLFDSQKNISASIRVVSRLAKKRNDFEFHIIGGGPDESMLEAMAQQAGIRDSVIFFHGRKDNAEVYEYLNKVNFVVVNSHVETFSVVTAEALACGKPVIATVSGGPEEILTEETGILIEKNNDTELESAIERMLNTFERYDGKKLQDSVAGRFSPEKVGKSFYDLYTKILDSNNIPV